MEVVWFLWLFKESRKAKKTENHLETGSDQAGSLVDKAGNEFLETHHPPFSQVQVF